jgi:Tol biopolymer transport system component
MKAPVCASMVSRLLSALLVLVGCGASAGQTADSEVSALATEVRELGWIVFSARSESRDWDLFACRPDGSGLRNLTHTPEFNEFAPRFSRDHTRLLFRRLPRAEGIDGNRYGAQGELVVAAPDASAPQVLGDPGELAWASWSAEGNQFATLSLKGVLIHDVFTGQPVRRLDRRGFFQQMTWSPDGRFLLGVANSFGTGWSIARMNVDTGEINAICRVDACTPDWFPDSQGVIFSWRPPGQSGNNGYGWTQLWRADADGLGRSLVFGEDGRHVYGGHISPDGKYVMFTGNMEEDGDPGRDGAPMSLMRLRDAPIIGGESKELRARHPNAQAAPVLSLPTGWEPCWVGVDLFKADAVSTRPLPQTSADRLGAVSRLAADVRSLGWLAFSAKSGSGDWDLFAMRPDGSDLRPITHTSEWNEAGVRFSPDGRRLLYYQIPGADPVDNNTYGTYDLVLARADGSEPELLGAGYQWASWGPDSRHIACLGPKGIRIVDVETRVVVRELPRRGIVSQLVWSPDDRWFAGTANGLGPFWTIGCLDAQVGAIRAVSETDRYNCTPDWMPDSNGLVYARGMIPDQPGRAELWTTTTDGTSRHLIYREEDRHIYGACVSPDGHYVVFTRSDHDLGEVPDIEMALIRFSGTSEETSSPGAARLDLGPGWEPHWTATHIFP